MHNEISHNKLKHNAHCTTSLSNTALVAEGTHWSPHSYTLQTILIWLKPGSRTEPEFYKPILRYFCRTTE